MITIIKIIFQFGFNRSQQDGQAFSKITCKQQALIFFIQFRIRLSLMGCSESIQSTSPQSSVKIAQILNFSEQSAESSQQKNQFSSLLTSIQDEIKTNPEYDSLLDRSLPLKILNEFKSNYVSAQSTSTLISIVLDYMALCKKEYGVANQLKTTFQAGNVATAMAEKYQKESNKIYFNNKDILKILAYICKLEKYPSNFVTHCYLDLKFDFDMEEIRKIALVVKEMFRFDLRSFFYLTNYLYKSCLNLQKQGKKLREIQAALLNVLNTLAEQNPPAQPLKGQDSLFKKHENYKIDPTKLKHPALTFTQQDRKLKMQELDLFIEERVKQSKRHYPKFSSSLKEICEKEGFHFKSGVKVKDMNQQRSVERVKEKLLDKNFSRYSVDDYLKSPQSKQSIEEFTQQEHNLYQQQIINMFDRIKDQIKFEVSDMLRGKCMYSDVQKINNTCSQIKNMYESSDCKIVQIDNRLLGKTNTSDLVMKILFGNTITQLQLVIDLNLASYEFSHKIYELMRSKFFSPITMLKRFNQQLTEDLLDEYYIVIKENSKSSQDFKQIITYTDVKDKFSHLVSLLPIPYKQKSKGAVLTLQSIKAYEEELTKIKQVKVQNLKQNCAKYKSNGDFEFRMKNNQGALQNYEKYQDLWRKQNPTLLEKIEKKDSNLTDLQRKNIDTFCESLILKGVAFQNNGKYDSALSTFQRYMAINKDVLKQKNKDAKVLMNIGFIYMKKGQGKKAEQYLKEATSIIEPLKNNNRWLYAEIMNKYGMVLKQEKKYQQALKYYNQSMNLYLQLEGGEGQNYSALNNNIGIIYKNLGNYSEALKYLNNSLDIKEKTIGKLSNDYATTLKITGQVLADQGRTEESLKVYDRVKEIFIKIRGPESSELAFVLDSIGSSLQDLRRYDESIQAYKESIRIKSKVFGEDSIGCSLTYNNIALIYTTLKDFKLAHEYLQKCLAIEEKVKGKGHIQTAATFCNIGALFKDQKKYQQAHKYYQQCLQIQQKHYGKGHIEVATTLNNIGLVYRLQSNYQQALKYYQMAKSIRQKVKGKNSMDYGLSMNNIAFVYSCQKKYAEAIQHMQVSQQIYESIKGKQSIQNIQKLQNLALWNRLLNKYKQSIELYQRTLVIRIKKGWNNVIQYPNCISNIALCYLNLQNYDQAIKRYQQSFLHFERLKIKTDNFYLCKYNYGRCFQAKKEWNLALQQFLISMGNFEEKKNTQLINCLSNIEKCYRQLGDNQNAEIYHNKIETLKPK